jgi:hypothetical protein
MATELSARLLQFIRQCVPTYQAAEVLLFLAANPDHDFSPEEIVVAMRPSVITYPAVIEYTALFAESALISETDGRFRYQPATRELEEALGALAHAYNERPVTLIRTIYRIADSKIQAFSDSFKLRED